MFVASFKTKCYLAFLNSLLVIIHIVSILKNFKNFYLVKLKHHLEMSVISEANICAEVKKYRNEIGTEDHGNTRTRIVRICTEEAGNLLD